MTIRSLITVAAVFCSTTSAEAQGLTLNVGGGAAFPVGSFGEVTGTGWHGLVGIGLTSLMQPIGLRLDVAHYRFEADETGSTRGITPATLNLSYRVPMTNSSVSPYVAAGAGVYHLDCVDGIDCENETRFGWNAGLGTKIAALRLKWFLELRFHASNGDSGNVRFVPITLGVTF
jgi:hypothetical protein